MIKQLNTIALIIAAVWATPAFAQTYNVVEDISGTFTELHYGINNYTSNYAYVLANLVSGDASLFSTSLTTIDNGSIDLVTGDSYCSGLCSTVETLLNGDKIFSTFTYNANFDGVATVNFSGITTITGGTGLFANAKGSGTFTGFDTYLTDTSGVSFQRVVSSISTPSAVPEPETYSLMIAGLGLISFAASRKKS